MTEYLLVKTVYAYTNVLLEITSFDWSLWRCHTVKLIYWWWGPKDLISVWILLQEFLSNLSFLKQNHINSLYCEPFMVIVFFFLEFSFASVWFFRNYPVWMCLAFSSLFLTFYHIYHDSLLDFFSNWSNCYDCDTVTYDTFTCSLFSLLFSFLE